MATNYIQPGLNLTVNTNGNVNPGQLVVVGDLTGVALTKADNGKPVTIATQGVFKLAKTSALAINAGDLVYAAATAGDVNKTASNRVCIGVAVSGALNPSPTVDVLLGARPIKES
jgi:predicted RecA/RadA family phage recombinase